MCVRERNRVRERERKGEKKIEGERDYSEWTTVGRGFPVDEEGNAARGECSLIIHI